MSDHSENTITPAETQNDVATEVAQSTELIEVQSSAANVIEYDLDSPELYLNRELTWLQFNRRVLQQATDPRVPLLERVKFLAISDGNLDEFVMKRIGGLKQQLAAGVQDLTVDGRTPAQQITECHTRIREFQRQHQEIFGDLLILLDEAGIQIEKYDSLTADQRMVLRERYFKDIFPIVSPLAMDPAHSFPFISNQAINLLVTMRFPGTTEIQMARVKVPAIKDLASRFLEVSSDDHGQTFVTLEEVIANNLDLLFPGMEIESCEQFRVTRNVNVELQDEIATDLLEMIETEVRERHFAPIVRLEVMSGMDVGHRGMLAAELGLDEDQDVFDNECLLGLRDLFEIAALDYPELHETPHYPVDHPVLGNDNRNIFHIIRENGPLLLQHPYQSFGTSIERFLRCACEDPKVLAIKMTLYRTSADSPIIEYLVTAARNGIQVAVLIELKARFDEAANIGWARRLEEVGVHVTYGVIGLKTHSKIILAVRKDFNGLRRYCHISTGNYHPGTARLYCDLGMLTCDDAIGNDMTSLFNYLTGISPPPGYAKILVAPHGIKKALIKKIEREASLHSAESPGHIQLKCNALEDADVTRALYKASQTGVKVDLIIRDSCRFRPGLPGLSDTATVISVVGRFLEHARVYYFHNGGDEEFFIGSADLMRRNLEHRVEVIVPVEDPDLCKDLRLILNAQLSDVRSVWEMQPDGNYQQRQPSTPGDNKGSQERLIDAAQKRLAAASIHKEKKVRNKLLNRFQKRLRKAPDLTSKG